MRALGDVGAVSVGDTALTANLANQSGRHQLNLIDFNFERIMLKWRQKLKIPSEQKEIVQFTRRTQGDMEILFKLSSSCPAAAFSNIGRNRKCGTSHLTGQPITLRLRERRCNPVDAQSHGMTFSPNHELAKVLHCLALISLPGFTYNLILITYNWLWGTVQC